MHPLGILLWMRSPSLEEPWDCGSASASLLWSKLSTGCICYFPENEAKNKRKKKRLYTSSERIPILPSHTFPLHFQSLTPKWVERELENWILGPIFHLPVAACTVEIRVTHIPHYSTPFHTLSQKVCHDRQWWDRLFNLFFHWPSQRERL